MQTAQTSGYTAVLSDECVRDEREGPLKNGSMIFFLFHITRIPSIPAPTVSSSFSAATVSCPAVAENQRLKRKLDALIDCGGDLLKDIRRFAHLLETATLDEDEPLTKKKK
jgi:hypothetical protein